jgi:translocation and assembly module TamB
LADDEEEGREGGPRRRFPIFLALLIMVALVLLLVWSARKPIARNVIDDALTRRGVPARYVITRFGVRSQRLENIVIGDPKAPDLTAEWAEVGFGFSGIYPSLKVVRAKGVRVRGRIIDGKLSLGALDRLLPKPSGEPFALPNIDLALDDARMRLETPAGVVGLALSGRGNLTDGFMGRLAAISKRLESGGCVVDRPTAVMHIAIADRQPALDGPLRASRMACGSNVVENPRSAIDVAFSATLERWRGGAMIAAGAVGSGGYGAEALQGRISFNGDARDSDAHVALGLEQVRLGGLDRNLAGFDGTPLGPVMPALKRAVGAATRHLDVDASLHLASEGKSRTLHAAPLTVTSTSGARLEVAASGERGIGWRWPDGRIIADGKISLSGGGFPDSVLRLRHTGKGFEGKYWMKPYAVPGARLAMDPLSFDAGGFFTRVRMDGPLADGRIEGLDIPIVGRTSARGLAINPGCFPLSFTGLRVAGTRIGATRLPVCPVGGALFARASNGGVTGGASVAGPRLRGTIGDAPLLMSARRLAVGVARPGFTIDGLAIRLGTGADPTRLDIRKLGGEVDRAGFAGTLAGAAGKIGAVPLLISDGNGRWTLRNSVLALQGSAAVDDSDANPRFHQLASRDVALTLRNGVITGSATLRHPRAEQTITRVTLAHDLGTGTGHALLDVPGITFTDAFQPEALTRLTLGVIANAQGMVTGSGRIDWDRKGVRSTGDFATDKMDFAAAFGPVTGLQGKIHFSDLLAMETPPGQTVTLGAVNAGISVENGVVNYQLLPDQMVRVEQGRWPFSGGQLLLEPTLLDFGKPSDRHLTFRVIGMDAAQFVEQFEFKNIAVTGTFDGVLPMIFDVHGGRIEGGRLVVRESGGTLAYVGEISNEKLGRFGNMAFDALKSIRYGNLAIELNGSLDGEIVSKVIFSGTNEAPVAVRKGLLGGLVGLPFKFNITISAPFRSLVNSAQSINDPRGLVKGSLEQQRARDAVKKTVQPEESEKVR